LHLAASAFAKAINAGRVLVFSSPERDSFIYRDSKRCGDSRGWDCWFEPVSKCVPDKKSDVWYGQGHAHGKRAGIPSGLGCDPKYGQKGCRPFAVNGINETWIQTAGGAYPFRFQALLECSNVHPLQYPYWWSAQAMAYLMRFTDRTRKEIDELRATKVLQVSHGQLQQSSSRILRIPPGTISVYVRHGKKGIEAPLYPWSTYLKVMEQIATSSSVSIGPPNISFVVGQEFASRVVVVGTEDPEVITSARKTAWSVIYSDYPRSNKDTWMISKRSIVPEVLNAFLNLELALESDAFILTLSSNWCRLIDELRMTVAGKSDAILVSVSSNEVSCMHSWDRKCRRTPGCNVNESAGEHRLC
jgi:hypothetical protein